MFTHTLDYTKRSKADLLVLPYWKGEKKAEEAADANNLTDLVKAPVEVGDFKGKEGEISLLYIPKNLEPRVVLLGLGSSDKATVETIRRSFGALTKFCREKKIEKVNLLAPVHAQLGDDAIARGISEGILHSNYVFDALKKDSIKEDPTSRIEKVSIIGLSRSGFTTVKKVEIVFGGVYLARDLANGNADDVTPQHLVKVAQGIAKDFSTVKATIFDKKRIEKEKMGLLLAVNQGSFRDPAFIVLEYAGNPKSKDKTVVVGKGITYDTGGLNLKPTGFMETMKCDMSGAACALGTIFAAASLKLKTNVTAVIPTTENSIGSKSFKPGDVYISYSGKSVEIGNTDAEGRLILADALAWSCKNLKPSRIFDFATLTGAIVIALGDEVTGFMSNNDALAESLSKAGQETFERVWRLPLFEEYKKQLKSDVADLNNVGGREAGSITAAIFLQQFVDKDIPWAHCDIAGTAFLKSDKRYLSKMGTGVGVRLMIEMLENHL